MVPASFLTRRHFRRQVVTVVLGSLAVLGSGWWIYRAELARAYDRQQRDLAAIATWRVAQVTTWGEARRLDAALLAGKHPVLLAAQALVSDRAQTSSSPATDRRLLLSDALESVIATGPYTGGAVLTLDGRLLAGTSGLEHLAHNAEHLTMLRLTLAQAIRTARPAMSNFFPASATTAIDVLAPILDDADRPIAVLLLRARTDDPRRPLFPRQRAEGDRAVSVLVQRDDSSVTEIEGRGRPILRRFSLSQETLPAVQSTRGVRGAWRGIGADGVPILANLDDVPGTPWVVLVRIDEAMIIDEELVHAMRSLAMLLIGLLAITGALALLLRTRHGRLRRHLAETVRQRLDDQRQLAEQAGVLADAQRVARLGTYQANFCLDTWTSSAILDDIFGIDASHPRTIASWEQLIHPTDRDRMRTYLQEEILGAGRAFDQDYRIVRVIDGAVRWVHGVGEVTRDATGPIGALMGTIQDITERKQAELVLRRDEARFRALTRILQFAATDPHEVIDFAVREALQLTDSPVGHLLAYDADHQAFAAHRDAPAPGADGVRAVHHPRDAEHTAGLWGQAVRQSRVVMNNQVVDVDPLTTAYFGELPPITRLLTLPIIRGGRTLAVLGVANKADSYDATDAEDLQILMDTAWTVVEQRDAVASLRASEARRRSVIETAMDGFWRTDADYRFLEVNEAYARLSGYTVAELLLMKVSDVEAPSEVALSQQHVAHLLATGEGRFETRHRRKDGTEFLAEVSVQHHRAEGGQFVAFVRDMTARKEMEESLVCARDAAELAVRAKSNFLATVSHEIRTPMNGVLGMTNLLADTVLDDTQRAYVRHAKQSTESLICVINDILDYSKMEAGKMAIDPVPFDLTMLVQDVAALLRPKAAAQGLALTVRTITPKRTRVVGDNGRIRQVLLNLINNAVKFTAQGEVLIDVTARPTSAGTEYRVAVTDTGIGIAPGVLPGLFQPFTQADASTSRRFGGTGLGLSICKQLVELMGGAIGADSTEGQGSTFWFTLYLPLAPQYVPTPIRTSASPLLPLLRVGPSAADSDVLLAQASLWGFTALTVLTTDAALTALRAAATEGTPFRMVLADAGLPAVQDGTFVQTLRTDPALAPLGLAVTTFHGEPGDAARFHQMGVDAYLSLPLLPEVIYAAVLAVVARGPGWRATNPLITRHTLIEAQCQSSTVIPALTPSAPDAEPLREVLLVEDNAINQLVATAVLEKLGCRVTLAVDGAQGVAQAATRVFAVIFMDMQMPVMDGLIATATIRAGHGPNAKSPIVAMTANALQEDRERCIASGMDDYVAKPITLQSVREAMQRATLARSGSAGAPAGPDTASRADAASAPSRPSLAHA